MIFQNVLFGIALMSVYGNRNMQNIMISYDLDKICILGIKCRVLTVA